MKINNNILSILVLAFLVGHSVFSISLPCSSSYLLPPDSQNPRSVAFSQDGLFLATANYNTKNVTLFAISNGMLSKGTSYALPAIYYPYSRDPQSVVFLPNALVVGDAIGDIVVFMLKDGLLSDASAYYPRGGPHDVLSAVTFVALSPNAQYLAAAVDYNNVVIFQVNKNGTLGSQSLYNTPEQLGSHSVAFSKDGTALCTANTPSNTISVFPVYSNGTLGSAVSNQLPSQSHEPLLAVFSPDGNCIATANWQSDDVSMISSHNSTSYHLPSGSTSPRSIAFSPDGKYLVTANGDSHDFTLFMVSSNCTLGNEKSYPLPDSSKGPSTSIAFSPDGGFFAIANPNSNDVSIFQLACYIKQLQEQDKLT